MAASGQSSDAYFKNNVLLLHGDGTNGAQNNTFVDSSSNNFTVTRNGNSTQGTFTPFSVGQRQWSWYFDGTGDYITVADNAALDLGTGDFTIECWVWPDKSQPAAYPAIMSKGAYQGANAWALVCTPASNSVTFQYGATPSNIDATGALLPNVFSHLAVVRAGNTLTIYINGVSKATGTVTTDFSNANSFVIGRYDTSGSNDFAGYISNLRLVKGTAVYTAAFTPPAGPLQSIANTSLYTLYANRPGDGSSNGFGLSLNGNVRATPFSPFQPLAAYDKSVNGGSGYFDGTGDYLTVANNTALQFGTGNFTIQCWVYRSVAGANHIIAAKGATTPTGWTFWINSSNQLVFTNTSTDIATTSTIPAGVWCHVAVVRAGTGTNQLTLYINGVSSATGTVSTNYNQTEELKIGVSRANGSPFNGYISDLEIVKGTALTITVPSDPATTANSPSLLLNFTNAAIFDSAAKVPMETGGNVQLNTTTKKIGTASIYFDGTGDLLTFPSTPFFDFSSGLNTFEFWIYPTAFPAAGNNCRLFMFGANNNTNALAIAFDSNGLLYMAVPSSGYTSLGGITLTLNTWQHVAIVQNGSSSKTFKDGVLAASGTITSPTAGSIGLRLGYDSVATANFNYAGYLDDVRITKGVARYDGDFTPPPVAHLDK